MSLDSAGKYLEKMKIVENYILVIMEQESNDDENYNELFNYFQSNQILNNVNELNSVLHLLQKITNNYHRSQHFHGKTEKILLFLKDRIKQSFSNTQIFTIFKSNKQILLFLIQIDILKVDNYFFQYCLDKYNKHDDTYFQFFSPELKIFIQNSKYSVKYDEYNSENGSYLVDLSLNPNSLLDTLVKRLKPEILENFDEKRQKGENESYICELIREDAVEEFISYMSKTDLSFSSFIPHSIFETNSFLLSNEKTSLIEYAAFFGSIQIFNYLRLNKAEISSSLLKYVIHSDNAELIQILEEDNESLRRADFDLDCFNEAIKCHNNNITQYFEMNLDPDYKTNNSVIMSSLKSYNFKYIELDSINNEKFFYDLCKYDYTILLEYLITNNDINIYEMNIFTINVYEI